MKENIIVDCGWGKLLFGETFSNIKKTITELKKERKIERNILFYPLEPQLIMTSNAADFFLNPAYIYKLDIEKFSNRRVLRTTFIIRKADTEFDIEELNKVYIKMKMLPLRKNWFAKKHESITVYVVEDKKTKEIYGGLMLLDHVSAFKDDKKSTSIWSVVVSSIAPYTGMGKALMKYAIQESKKKKRERIFLSVVATNIPAQRLYEQLGFVKTPILMVKNKTPINEELFVSREIVNKFSSKTKGIIKEALKKGIQVRQINDDIYELSLGGQMINCDGSLSEKTSAIMQEICQNQKYFLKMLDRLNVHYPISEFHIQQTKIESFLAEHKKVVLKTMRKNITSNDIIDNKTLHKQFSRIRQCSNEVLIQESKEGTIYRVLVMKYKVISVVETQPPIIMGNGKLTVAQLIKKLSRRKQSASDGVNKIPMDSKTKAFVLKQGYSFESILEKGEELQVRKKSSYYTGGTMKDVSSTFPENLKKIAIKIAKYLNISVMSLEIIVPDIANPEEYFVLEASEKPNLQYYTGQNVYKKFIDLLF
ncbi:TPA: GNAT family N-acetyltransferase [Candidatus Gracilibacteria bacterium]|nr:GNAT family N-acetyltransferase [Candidatus Peregrinibacteria bacterium]HIQ56547.1 GNAT family N-acetyltransferase [Candidatus Gracilibacteria bacterium]HIQ57410.1 GNAT family N-acetyltransferase [Candidatus Gracilibacteria bacterium]